MTKRTITTAAEIASGIEVTNKNSVTAKGKTACDINVEIEATKENKFGTYPISSSDRENEAPPRAAAAYAPAYALA